MIQPTRCSSFSGLLFVVSYSSTCFGHPHAWNRLSCIKTTSNKPEKLLHLVGWFIWITKDCWQSGHNFINDEIKSVFTVTTPIVYHYPATRHPQVNIFKWMSQWHSGMGAWCLGSNRFTNHWFSAYERTIYCTLLICISKGNWWQEAKHSVVI
jgi:hypothetical protein